MYSDSVDFTTNSCVYCSMTTQKDHIDERSKWLGNGMMKGTQTRGDNT